MHVIDIAIAPFQPEHLESALGLSLQARWPHRLEDWQMALSMSEGFVAVEADGTVVGTILLTCYGEDCATINMVIVDETKRGCGLGRRLMDAALTRARDRSLRLIATEEGLPLYRKLGFSETGRVLQHQGIAAAVTASSYTVVATPDDLAAIAALDREAYGADRGKLISELGRRGRFAVIRRNGGVSAFAALRAFGRGEVVGPVVAPDLTDASALIAHFASQRTGAFLRVDTLATTGLGPWLSDIGLSHVGGGIAMTRPDDTGRDTRQVTTFALVNQAFG